jgi:DUF1009 family protein
VSVVHTVFGPRVGLLAGSGRFPILFAEAARKEGMDVVCVAIHGADPALESMVSRLYWTGVAKLGRMIRCFQRECIDCVVMAGKVQKVQMYDPWRIVRYLPDWRMIRFWLDRRRRDNKDDTLLLGVIGEFAKDGIRFASALEVCPDLLVKRGVLTRRQPTAAERRDIVFGWSLAMEMGRLDVGQSVAVKEAAVLAVEAIEGTDRAIIRAGELCPAGGFTVVKVAKPQQDMRFDVPTVGVATIESMRTAGAKVLAVEAEKTILLDADETIQAAERAGITIASVTAADLENDLKLAAG